MCRHDDRSGHFPWTQLRLLASYPHCNRNQEVVKERNIAWLSCIVIQIWLARYVRAGASSLHAYTSDICTM